MYLVLIAVTSNQNIIVRRSNQRKAKWTESIAVGDKKVVPAAKSKLEAGAIRRRALVNNEGYELRASQSPGNFSQYHLKIVDIEKKFSHIGILRKFSQFSGFNMSLDVTYVIVLIKHLNLQLGFCC